MRIAGAVLGLAGGIAMVVGALGPWATTPLLVVHGWSGIGLPLIVAAAIALAAQGIHLFAPNRGWLVVSLSLGLFTLIYGCGIAFPSKDGFVAAIARDLYARTLNGHNVPAVL